MSKRFKQALVVLSIGILFLFVIFVINQTVQIVHLAHSIAPLLGSIVKYLLIGIYAFLIAYSLYQFMHLPKPLKMPEGKGAEGYKLFLSALLARLRKNKNLSTNLLEPRADGKTTEMDTAAMENKIKAAEKELDQSANTEIRTTAQSIFISTAVSQSGSLDSFVVLVGQVRMIWRIARIYNQRPALRELTKLYANVAATSFTAKAIEDLDFAEIIDPVIKSFSSSGLINFIPVISIVSNSIFSGATNALLTLRIGIITRKYCSLFSQLEAREKYGDDSALKKFIKTSAIREAGKQLGGVIVTPSQTVLKMVMNGLKKSKEIPGKVMEEMEKMTKDMVTRVTDLFKRTP